MEGRSFPEAELTHAPDVDAALGEAAAPDAAEVRDADEAADVAPVPAEAEEQVPAEEQAAAVFGAALAAAPRLGCYLTDPV